MVKERIIGKSGGIRFPGLDVVHDEIENKLIKRRNSLLFIMDWTIYKFLHESSKHLNFIYPHYVNREYLRQVFEEDLFSVDPEDELYEAQKKYKKI